MLTVLLLLLQLASLVAGGYCIYNLGRLRAQKRILLIIKNRNDHAREICARKEKGYMTAVEWATELLTSYQQMIDDIFDWLDEK